MTLTTTLNEIRKHGPCEEGWEKLLMHLGKTKADDEPVSFETILKSNGVDDALWCLRALPESMDRQCRLLCCLIAETALKYVPEGEDRPRQAIETALLYALGKATEEELATASAAALAAARAASRAAARAAVRGDACAMASWATAGAAARDAAAWKAARGSWDAAERQQEQIFRDWLGSLEPSEIAAE